MGNSFEMRWFTEYRDEKIVSWFGRQGFEFEAVGSRTDHYLVSDLKDDLGIKLREGNIELKQRRSKSAAVSIAESAVGCIEEWTKWSFNLKVGETESGNILMNRSDQWMAVEKKRIQIKIDDDGKMTQVKNTADIPDSGCLMEYTRLEFRQKVFYSFAAEIIGLDTPKLQDTFLPDILKNFTLSQNDSYGYPEFFLNNLGK